MIRIEIPGPAVAKGRPRATVIGERARMYTPAATESYEAKVAWLAKQAMAGRPPLDQAVEVVIRVGIIPPQSWSKKKISEAIEGRRRPLSRPDLDNLAKSVSDGLNGVIYVDDARICNLIVSKHYAPSAGVVVEVKPL